MRLSKPVALLAVTAAAATPFVSVVAADAATKKPTTLSIRAAHSAVTPRSKDTISGTLRSGSTGLVGLTVVLKDRQAGTTKWLTVASKKTVKAGAVAFSVVPAHQQEQYELVFGGNATYAASHSGTVTVAVKRTTSLSVVAAKSTVKPNTTDTISGTLLSGKSAVAKAVITIRERKAGTTKWLKLSTGKTGSTGHVSFKVTPPNSKEQYELVFAGTTTYFASHSGVVTVTVS